MRAAFDRETGDWMTLSRFFNVPRRGRRRGGFRRVSAFLAILLVAALDRPGTARSGDLERGRYLVETVMACDNCHTPRGPGGYVADKRFSGGSQVFSDKAYTVRGSNITPDAETGVGAWSDDRLKAAIVAGVGPKGRLAPAMPSEFYRVTTDADLDAVVAYLRSVAPVKAAAPEQIHNGETPSHVYPGAEKPYAASDLDDPLRRGFYVATLARCMECHSGETDGVLDHRNRLGAGGKLFRNPAGTVVGANITSHPIAGVGAWTDDEIKRAITRGLGRGGRPLKPTMARLSEAHYSKMSAADLDALVAWLRTVPPLE